MEKADEYFAFLEKIGVDGVIISDLGLISIALKRNLNVNVSTQASILNKATVQFYKDLGVKRVILARELSLKEVKEISSVDIEVETFIHGAMCISYSGRCLLSNYLTGRDSNRGACVQACRWEYSIREKNTDGEYLEIEEDDKGTYILNSKDLNLIDYIGDLVDAGVVSFKIEGRMKSDYYLATVINAYRRAIDAYFREGEVYKENPLYMTELKKTAHRCFTTAYAFGENDKTVNYDDSQSKGTHKFMAKVLDFNKEEGYALIEMRNRFKKGEVLEVLSPNDTFNKQIVIEKMLNLKDEEVLDAKLVQEKLKLFTDIGLQKGDMLRKEF